MGVSFYRTNLLNMKFTITLLLVCALAFSSVSASNDTELAECTAADNAVSFALCPTSICSAAKELCDAMSGALKDACETAADSVFEAAGSFDSSAISDCTCPETAPGCGASGSEVIAFSVMACLIGLFL